jgi:hypothetical protein
MINNRFEGEKKLSGKLEELDAGFDNQSLADFEMLLDQSEKPSLNKMVRKWFGLGIVLLSVVCLIICREEVLALFSYNTTSDSISLESEKSNLKGDELSSYSKSEELSDVPSKEVDNTQKAKEDINLIKSVTDDQVLRSLSNNSVTRNSGSADSSIDKIQENTNTAANLIVENGGNNNDLNSSVKDPELNEPTSYVSNIITEKSLNNTSEQNTTVIISNTEREELDLQENISNSQQLDFEKILSPALLLSFQRSVKDPVLGEMQNPIVPTKENNKVSFGFMYHFIQALAASHTTPFVSPFSTRIESINSYGYGLFGTLAVTSRSSMRASFNYFRIGHRQYVEDLIFPSGPDRLILELYSNELRFGLDYVFDVFPGAKFMHLKIGAGVYYHNVINLESNNFYEQESSEVDNLNRLIANPFSYRMFFSLEKEIYKSFSVGIEPYLIYQKRTARYTESSFIADEGDHNFQVGLGVMFKF